MNAYASRTGTKRNLSFLRDRGWRLMVSARGVLRCEGFRYALDNGAWTSHQLGEQFNSDAFKKALDLLAKYADFIVLPDIVCTDPTKATVESGKRSLDFSLSWLDRTREYRRPMMLPVQDGMTVEMVDPVLYQDMGIFIGGSTEFKESTMGEWTDFAHMFGHHVHVGRVNSQRRLRMCQQVGVDSFDGSGPSRFIKHARTMDALHRQESFPVQ